MKGRNGEKRRNDLVKINLPGYLPGAHRVLTVEIYGVSRGPLVTGPPEALRASLFLRQRNVFFKNRDRSNERDHCYYPPPPPSCVHESARVNGHAYSQTRMRRISSFTGVARAY